MLDSHPRRCDNLLLHVGSGRHRRRVFSDRPGRALRGGIAHKPPVASISGASNWMSRSPPAEPISSPPHKIPVRQGIRRGRSITAMISGQNGEGTAVRQKSPLTPHTRSGPAGQSTYLRSPSPPAPTWDDLRAFSRTPDRYRFFGCSQHNAQARLGGCQVFDVTDYVTSSTCDLGSDFLDPGAAEATVGPDIRPRSIFRRFKQGSAQELGGCAVTH